MILVWMAELAGAVERARASGGRDSQRAHRGARGACKAADRARGVGERARVRLCGSAVSSVERARGARDVG